jgi:hypothetical protein
MHSPITGIAAGVPQLPLAREVDAGLTTWFRRHLPDAGQAMVS